MFSFLSVRVIKNGGNNCLQSVSGDDLTQFVSSGKSVVFFTNNRKEISYANFGIYKHRNDFKFATSNISEGNKYGVFIPSVVAFDEGKKIQSVYKGRNSGPFLRWLSIVSQWGHYKVQSTEELRQILCRPTNTIFAVDVDEIPARFKDNDVTIVSKDLLSVFNVTVDSGMHLMRGCDRQMIKIENDDLEAIGKCELDSLGSKKQEYLATYIINSEDNDVYEKSIDLMKKLKKEFINKVSFVPLLSSNQFKYIVESGNLARAKPPYFVMFKSDDISERRWILYGEKESLVDHEYVKNFIERVIKGEEEYGIVSKPGFLLNNYGPFKEISVAQFDDLVIKETKPVLVAFTAPWCGHCRRLKPVLNATAELIADLPIKIYMFDSDGNDHPRGVPEVDGFPTIYFWNRKTEIPVEYEGKRDIPSLIEYFKNNTNVNMAIPEYNETELMNKYTK